MSGDGVAYFSMEYGLHSSLKNIFRRIGYTCWRLFKKQVIKERKITAVGLLYRYGYFTQKLSANGEQEAEYEAQDFL